MDCFFTLDESYVERVVSERQRRDWLLDRFRQDAFTYAFFVGSDGIHGCIVNGVPDAGSGVFLGASGLLPVGTSYMGRLVWQGLWPGWCRETFGVSKEAMLSPHGAYSPVMGFAHENRPGVVYVGLRLSRP